LLSLDIVVITETWLSPNVSNSAINLNGFSIFRRDRRDGRRGGGVCVYVNDHMPVVHLKELSHPEVESLWLLIKPSRLPRGINSIILAAIYHPPKSDDRVLLTHLIESLDSALISIPRCRTNRYANSFIIARSTVMLLTLAKLNIINHVIITIIFLNLIVFCILSF
jgi:hypothetical protein